MSFNVTRIYKNAAGTVLRTDSIYWTATSSTLNTGTDAKTYARRVVPVGSYSSAIADRDVASIELETDADTVDIVNYLTVAWVRASGTILGDMSDLPAVGATV